MTPTSLLAAAEAYVKHELQHDSSGHDWWHIYRVVQTAKAIAREEQADVFICELAALLHDVADEKFNENKASGLAKVKSWLDMQHVDQGTQLQVMEIISTMSFASGHKGPMRSLEGQVVQDADRLDAIGATGITRVFAYAGAKGSAIFDPELPARQEMTNEEYRSGKSTAINHFAEKLLKLKDRMNTRYGKIMAEERHQFMETFLEQFFAEWEGTK